MKGKLLITYKGKLQKLMEAEWAGINNIIRL